MSGVTAVPEWAEEPTVAPESPVEILHQAVLETIKTHKNPAAYFNKKLGSAEDKKKLHDYIVQTFPLQDDVVYCFDKAMPGVEKEEMGHTLRHVLHVASFMVGDASSIKPSAGEDVCTELQGFIFQEGFITGSEPLHVTFPDLSNMAGIQGAVQGTWPSGDQHFRPGMVGYIKGRARMENIMMLIHVNMELDFVLRDVHPRLFTSILRIYAHHCPQSSKREEAFLSGLRKLPVCIA